MPLKNVSQQSRFTGINIKLGQGNFRVAIKSEISPLLFLDFSCSSIGAEIVSYSFKQPNLVFQGLQLIGKKHTLVCVQKQKIQQKGRDKTHLLSLRLPGPWFYISHNSRGLGATLALAHTENQPKHHVWKQAICNFSQTSADLVFRSQKLFRTKTMQCNNITWIKTSYHGTASWKESSTPTLQFCLLRLLAFLLLLIFPIFCCKKLELYMLSRVVFTYFSHCCIFSRLCGTLKCSLEQINIVEPEEPDSSTPPMITHCWEVLRERDSVTACRNTDLLN